MKRYLFIALTILAGLLWAQTTRLRATKADNRRLEQNQQAAMTDIEHYRTKAGQEVASTQVLRLRVDEFKKLRAEDAALIRNMGIKLKRVEATAKTATQTVVELRAALRDTVVTRHPATETGPVVHDTLRAFRWRDPWVTVEGLIGRDSVACRIKSIDTLRQVVHPVPRKFLFIRWGVKGIRQEIFWSNPHARIVYSEFVKFEK